MPVHNLPDGCAEPGKKRNSKQYAGHAALLPGLMALHQLTSLLRRNGKRRRNGLLIDPEGKVIVTVIGPREQFFWGGKEEVSPGPKRERLGGLIDRYTLT